MVTDNDDILTDSDGDDIYKGGDFAVGDGRADDVSAILKLNTGQLKSDVILGPNLIMVVNKPLAPNELRRLIDLHLTRDNKDVKSVKVVNGEIEVKL